MRLATCVLSVALLALLAWPKAASADDPGPPSYRAVIDRVDLEPAAVGGLRLRVALSALALQGQLLDLTDRKSIKLLIGGSKLEAPYALGRYSATGADLAIVVVVEANLAYADALPGILSALDEVVLGKLDERAQVAILSYGEATGTGKLGSLKSGRGKLAQVSSDGSAGEPALLDTLDRAMLLLKRARTNPEGRPLRKMILVISDGRDRSGDRERVTQLGRRADRAGVRIHTLGYAPSNVRRPLLTLGELSKRSLGTFRWIRTGGADSWSGGLQQVRDEITRQYVLTYFLPQDAAVAGRKLKIVTVGRTEATSNELRIPEPMCGRDPCAGGYCADSACVVPDEGDDRGVLGWVVLVAGIALGALVTLGVIGYLLQRRHHAHGGSSAPLAPGQLPVPGAPLAPGQLPPGVKPPKPKGRQPRPPPQPIAAPAAGPRLLVVSGPRAGQELPLHNGFTIGKAPGSHLVLDDSYTSSQHAQIGLDHAGVCRLYDRNSTNGTFVNGVRVTEVMLDHGMNVRIGSTELRFLAQ